VWLQVVSQGLAQEWHHVLGDALKAALDLLSEISEQEPNIEPQEGWRRYGCDRKRRSHAALMLLNDQDGHSSPASALPAAYRLCLRIYSQYTLAQNKPKQNSQPKHRKATKR